MTLTKLVSGGIWTTLRYLTIGSLLFQSATGSIPVKASALSAPLPPPSVPDIADTPSERLALAPRPNGPTAPRVAVAPADDPSGPVTLYAGANFGGQAESFSTDDPDLSDNLIGVQSASSIQMDGTIQILLFDQPNYQGTVRRLTSGSPDLVTIAFDNRAASLKILAQPMGAVNISDDFSAPTLAPAWNWNPWLSGAIYSLTPNQFQIQLPAGNQSEPADVVALQRYDMGQGDFTLETHLELNQSDTNTPFQAGLVIGLGVNQNLSFGLADQNRLLLNSATRSEEVAYSNSGVYLKVEKLGQKYSFAYRSNSNEPWASLPEIYRTGVVQYVGLLGSTGNAAAETIVTFNSFQMQTDDVAPPSPPPDPAPDVHDPFDPTTLGPDWEWYAPLSGATFSLNETSGSLRLTLPAGATNFDNWYGGDDAPELRRRDLTADWAIQTQVTIPTAAIANTCCFNTGLTVAFGQYDRFIFGPSQGQQLRLEYPSQATSAINLAGSIVELRIEKTGSLYLFKYRSAPDQPWSIYDNFSDSRQVQWVGLMQTGWDNRAVAIVADYDYFDLTLSGDPSPDSVTLYDFENYGGTSETLTARDPDLSDSNLGNETASSVLIRGPVRAILFDEPNYQSWLASASTNTVDLSALSFNNATASVLMVPAAPGPKNLTDSFDTSLDPAWNWNVSTSTASQTLANGSFQITVPASDNNPENTVYLQRFDLGRGNFTLETQVSVTVSSSAAPYFTGLALGLRHPQRILFGLTNNGNLRLVRWGRQDSVVGLGSASVFLKVDKQGQAFTFSYRLNNSDPWQTLTTWSVSEAIEFGGLFSRAGGLPEQVISQFDYFHLESDDVAPVSGADPTPSNRDEFDSATLNNVWQWRAPQLGTDYSLANPSGALTITLPAGNVSFDNSVDIDNAPELRRGDLYGDWAIQTQLTVPEDTFTTCCWRTGLSVGFGTNDKLVFGLSADRALFIERYGQYYSDAGYAGNTVELRVEKVATQYVFKYRPANTANWIVYDTRYATDQPQWVGLITKGWDNRPAAVSASYEYFDLTWLNGLPPTRTDIAELNAKDWGSTALGQVTTTLTNDTTRRPYGNGSIKFVTDAGYDWAAVYPKKRNANWDLSGETALTFWIKTDNANSFQEPLRIRLGNRDTGGYIQFTPTFDIYTKSQQPDGILLTLPLAGDSNWVLDNSQGPLPLNDVDYIEFHTDTWDYGFTVWLDGVYVSTRELLPLETPSIERLSLSNTGLEASAGSYTPALSADGGYITFASSADNLVPNDTNSQQDIFVYDRETAQISRVNLSSTEAESNNYSDTPAISANGRYVAFISAADNLVPADTNGQTDVFVHDRETGLTTRVSVDSVGLESNNDSFRPAISGDGRFIVFASAASNLVVNDTNDSTDIFLHDRQANTTTRLSLDPTGVEANGRSDRPAISASGRYVVFTSEANNLTLNDSGWADIFVFDRQTNQTVRVSRDLNGANATDDSFAPAISGDGRYIVYASYAANIVANDTNRVADIFVYDQNTRLTRRITPGSNNQQANGDNETPDISADGRYVVFASNASNLSLGDNFSSRDVFLYDLQTGRTWQVNTSTSGQPGNAEAYEPSISGDGSYLVFWSSANNLIAPDTNGTSDVFGINRQLLSTRPALPPAPPGPGAGLLGEYFDNLELNGTPVTQRLDPRLDFGWGGSPATGVGPDNFSVRWTGQIIPQFSEDYTFYVGSEGGVRLWVNGTELINNWAVHGFTIDSGLLALTANEPVTIQLEFTDTDNFAGLWLDWASASTPLETIPTAQLNPPTGPAIRLQILLPGESAAPYTLSGRTGNPTSAMAGEPVNITIRAVDENWNTVLTATDSIALETTDPLAVIPQNLTLTNGATVVPLIFKTLTEHIISVVDNDPPNLDAASSNDLVVEAGPVARLALTAPDVVDVGQGFGITLTAYDQFDNLSSNYTLTANFTSSDTYANLPAPYGYDGQSSVYLTGLVFNTGGIQSLTVTDTINSALTITKEITVVAQPVQRVSVNAHGLEGDNSSDSPSLSSDGRYVVFSSYATNLVPGEDNDSVDIFIRDRLTGLISLASPSTSGGAANNSSRDPDISADGRYVTFSSAASNLVPDDTNGVNDIFVLDGDTGQMVRVSVDSNGTQATGDSYYAVISADGRYVVFSSEAENLVAADTNIASDIFVHDLVTGQTRRASVNESGGEGNGNSFSPDISANGELIVFASAATNLVPNDVENNDDVFVLNLTTGVIERVSLAFDNSEAGGNDYSDSPKLSADGRYVVFASDANNLVAADTNGNGDVFRYDRQTGQTVRVSVGSDGAEGNDYSYAPSVSNDGRLVAFISDATNLVAGDTNERTDLFIRDVVVGRTWRVSLGIGGQEGNGYFQSADISGDSSVIAYRSSASNLVANDYNNLADVFVANRLAITRLTDSTQNLQILLPGESLAPGSPTGKTGTPAPQTAGIPFTVTIRAVDVAWNLVSARNDTIVVTATDGQAELPATVTLNGGVAVVAVVLKTASTQTLSATDSDSPAIGASSSAPLSVLPDQVDHLALSAPEDVQTGLQFNVTLRALDVFGNLVTGYAGTIIFSSSDSAATLPISHTFSQGTGVETITGLTLGTAGPQTLTVEDTANSDLIQTGTINVVSNPTQMVSLNTQGQLALGPSSQPAISAEGRYVAFRSEADNLAPADINGVADIFVRDRFTGQTQLVSLGLGQVSSNGASSAPGISADGRYVVFVSNASNLVTADTNDAADIFVYDRSLDSLQRVSVTSEGSQAVGASYNPAISADGQYVVFDSLADNLAPTDTGNSDIFIHALQTGTTERLSVDGDGQAGNADSYAPSISAEGRYIAFASWANNLTSTDLDAQFDVFLKDRQTGVVTQITIAANGESYAPSISGDGNFVTFTSTASNLVATDSNGVTDVFLFNRATSQISQVSVNDSGEPGNANSTAASLSANGRFVVFTSLADNLSANDTNTAADVFVRDQVTGYTWRMSLSAIGSEGNGATTRAAISGNGADIALSSMSNNLVPADDNGAADIFVINRTALTALTKPIRLLQVLLPGEVVAPESLLGRAGSPEAQLAGVPFDLTVRVVDVDWATLVSASNTLRVVTDDGLAVLPASVLLNGGEARVAVTLKTAGSQTFNVSSPTAPQLRPATSSAVAVYPGAAVKLTMAAPAQVAVAAPFSVTVTAYDQFNNLATDYPGTVVFSSDDATATLPVAYTYEPGQATHTFSQAFVLKGSGLQTLTVTDSANALLTGSVEVFVADVAGRDLTEGNAANWGAGAIQGTTTVTDDVAVRTYGAGSIKFITDANSDWWAVYPKTRQANWDLSSENAITFWVKTQNNNVSGFQEPLRVRLGNSETNTYIQYTPTYNVFFAAGQTGGALVTIPLAGSSQWLRDDANGLTDLSDIDYVEVHTDTWGYGFTLWLDGLYVHGLNTSMTMQPTVGVADGVTPTTMTITARNADNSPIVNTPVSLAVISNTVGAKINNTSVAIGTFITIGNTDSNGVVTATFKTTLAGPVTLLARTDQTTNLDSQTFNFVAGPAYRLKLLEAGQQPVAGTATGVSGPTRAYIAGIPFTLTVQALDQYSNLVTSVNESLAITWTGTDPLAQVPTTVNLVNGIGAIPVTLKKTGGFTFTVTDSTLPVLVSDVRPIQMLGAEAQALEISAPATATAYSLLDVTVTARDQYGNTASGYTPTLRFSTSDTRASVPADFTLPSQAATRVFSDAVTFKTVGSQSLTVTDLTNPALTASVNLEVNGLINNSLTVRNGDVVALDDARYPVTTALSAGASVVPYNNLADIVAGDEIVIATMLGTGMGTFETVEVVAVNSGSLTLNTPLVNSYNGVGDKVIVQRVPRFEDVLVQSGGVITARAWDGATGGLLFFRAQNVTVETGGLIHTNGLGFRFNEGPGSAGASGGGGHGGVGGGASGGQAYGSTNAPFSLGGGGNYYGSGFTGGGIIRLAVTGALNVQGAITSAGISVSVSNVGGAGGSIWLTTQTLNGMGEISAKGSAGGFANYYGGGAGGRIAVQSTSNTFSGPLIAAGAVNGGPGTIYLEDLTTGYRKLMVDNLNQTGQAAVVSNAIQLDEISLTRKGHLELNVPNATWALNTLTVSGDRTATLYMREGTLDASGLSELTGQVAMYIYKDATLTLPPAASLSGANVTVYGTLEGGAESLTLSAAGSYASKLRLTAIGYGLNYPAGSYSFGNVDLQAGTLEMQSDPASGRGVTLTANNLSIAQTSSISADRMGYVGSGNSGQGGSHGGAGGYSGSPAYGSVLEPTALGGAGGFGGGGVIKLVVGGNAVIDGTITANGAAAGGGSGGGAGGSIWLVVGTVSGSGAIRANGGYCILYFGSTCGGGSGGRIATYYTTSTFTGVWQAFGGNNPHGNDGAPGTVYLKNSATNHSTLIIDNNLETGSPAILMDGAVTNWAFDEILLKKNGHLEIRQGDTLSLSPTTTLSSDGTAILYARGTLDLSALPEFASSAPLYIYTTGQLTLPATAILKGATVTNLGTLAGVRQLTLAANGNQNTTLQLHPTGHTAGVSAGLYDFESVTINAGQKLELASAPLTGAGVTVVAQTVTVSGALSADGLGYISTQNGLGVPTTVAGGGGHGGAGGGSGGGSAYGSIQQPITLGSASQTASGGGLVRLIVADGLSILSGGSISADGKNSTNTSYGAGAGGTVRISADQITGSGTIRANGGNRGGTSGNNTGGGGGGGRVAIYANILVPTITLQANGGAGATGGGAGATYLGATDSSNSTVVVNPAVVVANGLATSQLTITLLDAAGQPQPDRSVQVTVSPSATVKINGIAVAGAVTLGPSDASGQIVANITATSIGERAISVKNGSTVLASPQPVIFVAGPVSAANSTIVATPARVAANGLAGGTVTIGLRDAYNNPVSGASVQLTTTGAAIIEQPATATDANGQTTGVIRDAALETVTIGAIATGVTITDTAAIHFAGADVGVTLSGPTSIGFGRTVSYTLTVKNTGLLTAPAVSLSDLLPSELTYVSDTASPAATVSGQEVVWTVGDLAPNQQETFALTVRAADDGTPNAILVNTLGTTGAGFDENPADNTASESSFFLPPDLALTITATGQSNAGPSATVAVAGYPITYTLKVTNSGAGNAQNVTVTETLPTQLTFESQGSPYPFELTGNTITWQLGSVFNGAPKSITFVAQLAGGATGSVTNPASAATTTTEFNVANNNAAYRMTIEAPRSVIGLSPVVATVNALRGQATGLLVTVGNTGAGELTGLTLTPPASLPWLTIDTAATAATLPAGGQTTFMAVMLPESHRTPGYYRDFITVTDASGGSVNLPITIRVITPTRNLNITAQNDRNRLVPGALVTLVKQAESIVVTEGVTTQTYRATVQLRANANGLATFSGLEVGVYDYSLSAADHANASGTVTITEGAGAQIETLTLTALPALSVSPSSPVIAVLAAGNVAQVIEIRNTGLAALTNVQITTPASIPWVYLATPALISSIEPGEVVAFSIFASPPANVGNSIFQDYVTVTADGGLSAQVGLTVEIAPTATRDLQVTVNSGSSPVATGTITLIAQTPTAQVVGGQTLEFNQQFTQPIGPQGRALFTGLPVDDYNYLVNVSGSTQGTGQITVQPGATLQSETIALQPNPFTYTWSVEPIQQSYDITLTLTYDLNAPVPTFFIPERFWGFAVCGLQTLNDSITLINPTDLALDVTGFTFSVPGVSVIVGPHAARVPPGGQISVPVTLTRTGEVGQGQVGVAFDYVGAADPFVTIALNPSSRTEPLVLGETFTDTYSIQPVVFTPGVLYATQLTQPATLDWLSLTTDQTTPLAWTQTTNLPLGLTATPPATLADGSYEDFARVEIQGSDGSYRSGRVVFTVTKAGAAVQLHSTYALDPVPTEIKSGSAVGVIKAQVLSCGGGGAGQVNGGGWRWSVVNGGIVGTSRAPSVSPPALPQYVPPPVYGNGGQQVRLQIDQRVMLEGEGFQANFTLDSVAAIEVLVVDILLSDPDTGVDQTALFTITPAVPTGLGAIASGGQVSQSWLILPSGLNVTDPNGRKFNAKARLTYTLNGDRQTLETAPEEITVLPAPKLEIKYVLPLTQAQCTTFALKAIIKNVGAGAARNVQWVHL